MATGIPARRRCGLGSDVVLTPGIGSRGTDVPVGVGPERCEGQAGEWNNTHPTTTPCGRDPADRNRRVHRPPPEPRAQIAQSTLVLGLVGVYFQRVECRLRALTRRPDLHTSGRGRVIARRIALVSHGPCPRSGPAHEAVHSATSSAAIRRPGFPSRQYSIEHGGHRRTSGPPSDPRRGSTVDREDVCCDSTEVLFPSG